MKGFCAVVGSRSLPRSWAEHVSVVVTSLANNSWNIASGGAVGADQFALESVLGLGRPGIMRVYLPARIEDTPPTVRPWVIRLMESGGRVVQGTTFSSPDSRVYIRALFNRTRQMVADCQAVVAYLCSGKSAGTSFTICQAISRGIPVTVFTVGRATLPTPHAPGRWEKIPGTGFWSAAYRWVR
jgi:hypothetical protein